MKSPHRHLLRPSSLFTPGEHPPLPGTRANQAFISPSGWSSISNGRVNCKNVECFRSPLPPPLFLLPSSSRFTWFGWRQVWGGIVSMEDLEEEEEWAQPAHDDSSCNSHSRVVFHRFFVNPPSTKNRGFTNDEENIFQKSNPWDHLLRRRMD